MARKQREAEEAAAAASSMQDQAAKLTAVVSVFRINGDTLHFSKPVLSRPKASPPSQLSGHKNPSPPKITAKLQRDSSTNTKLPSTPDAKDGWEEF